MTASCDAETHETCTRTGANRAEPRRERRRNGWPAAAASAPLARAKLGPELREKLEALAKRLGLRRIVVANKWSEPMNRTLGEFFARGGTSIAGVAAEVMGPDKFQKIETADHMQLAYELGRQAFAQHPDAEGLYIGGGSWLSEPVCQALEREFGKPAISNQSAMIWDTLNRLGHWRPIAGQGRLLTAA